MTLTGTPLALAIRLIFPFLIFLTALAGFLGSTKLADEAVLVSDRAFAGSDTLATSYTLAQTVRKLGEYDLILCGKQAFDGDTAQVGPVIIAFGSPEQKREFLPRILNLDLWFCQGFSEPSSGSDLASLRTTAVLEGDHYVVNGSKIWTSLAQDANHMFLLARTSTDNISMSRRSNSWRKSSLRASARFFSRPSIRITSAWNSPTLSRNWR